MGPESTPTVAAFLESYRAAFESLDASAIADHFMFPCHVTGDAGEIALTAVPTRHDWMGALEGPLAMYRTIGFGSARVAHLAVTELSPRLVQAFVHWALFDRAGHGLYDFEATYTLGIVNGAWRIGALAHNEIPRYRQCLARLHPAAGPGDASGA